jgi:hypothetical protein
LEGELRAGHTVEIERGTGSAICAMNSAHVVPIAAAARLPVASIGYPSSVAIIHRHEASCCRHGAVKQRYQGLKREGASYVLRSEAEHS